MRGLVLIILSSSWLLIGLWAEEIPIRFEDVSETAGTAMKPRSRHPDANIAKALPNFVNVYAPGYFWNPMDVIFLDANGDERLDIFMLNYSGYLWSRLWLGAGTGSFVEVHPERIRELPKRDMGVFHRVLAYDFSGNRAQDVMMTSIAESYQNVQHAQRLTPANPEESDLGKFYTVAQQLGMTGYSLLLSDFDGDGMVDFAHIPEGYPPPGGEGWLRPGFVVQGRWELDRTMFALPLGIDNVPADFDNDGLPDILCRGLSDRYRDNPRLLHNGGKREFTDATKGSGLEMMPAGGPVAVADFDNDGRLDIYCTGGGSQGAPGGVKLYLNQGSGKFRDATEGSGLLPKDKKEFKESGGTATAADFDNDGLVDIFVCDGESNRLYRNLGQDKFADIVKESGILPTARKESRNAGGDFDADGRIDLVLMTPDRGIGLFRNVTKSDHGWIKVKLKGPAGNPEAAGAQVTVYEPGKLGQEEAILGYQENLFTTDFRIPRPLHFGLGPYKSCDVRVRFPGGEVVEKKDVQSAAVLVVSVEGKSAKEKP